jgi:hypothetical protein
MLCEFTGCTQTSDCPDPLGICSAGTCVVNFCVTDIAGNAFPGELGQTCDSWDAGSGTCIPAGSNFVGGVSGFCLQGGSIASGDPCVPLQIPLPNPATQSDQLCVAGDYCIPLNDGGGQCFDLGDGGCVVGLGAVNGVPNTELLNCGTSIDCQCPAVCVTDTALNFGTICESACTGDTDCPLAVEGCQTGNGNCSLAFCSADFSGNSVPGTLNGSCGAADAGNCIATTGQLGLAGICVLAGTAAAQSACDPFFSRSDPTLLCGGGLICVSGTANGGSACEALCDPSVDAGLCGTNEVCTDYTNGLATTIGFCCLPSAATCTAGQVCCSGGCAGDGTCL